MMQPTRANRPLLPIKDLDLRRLGLASIITIAVSLKLE
jgi:hypothetical protein